MEMVFSTCIYFGVQHRKTATTQEFVILVGKLWSYLKGKQKCVILCTVWAHNWHTVTLTT